MKLIVLKTGGSRKLNLIMRIGLLLALCCMPCAVNALSIAPLTREHSANNPSDASGSISVLPARGEEQWTAAVVAAKAGDDISWVTLLPVPPTFAAYYLSENFNAESRKALIVFNPSATFTLVQNGRGGTLTPSILTMGKDGGTANVDVTVMTGTKWRFENTNAWITFTSPVNNLNSGTRSLTLTRNSGLDPRVGSLVIAGQTLIVQQSGEDVILSTNALTVPYYFNLVSVAVSAVGSTVWKPVVNVPWITLGSSSPVQGSGQFSCLIAPNDGYTERTATVTVGSKTVTIRQIGNQRPTILIDPSHSTAAAAGASGNFNVTVTPGTPWSVTSQSPWLRVDNIGIRTGSGTVGVAALPNNTTQARVGYLLVARETPTLPAGVDPLFAFPKALPVLAHLTDPASGIDEVLKKSVWSQVVVLGPREVQLVAATCTWVKAFENAQSESSTRITMLASTSPGNLPYNIWINKVKADGRYEQVRPEPYGNGLPLVNSAGEVMPREFAEYRYTLTQFKANTSAQGYDQRGVAYLPTETLRGYSMLAFSRTNLDQRLISTAGFNLANGVSMVLLADPSRRNVFVIGTTEIVLPGNANSPPGAQTLLVASVAASGKISIFADGSPVMTKIATNAPGILTTSFYPGYRCTVYGTEIGQQTAAELSDSLNPTRIYEVRQDAFKPSVAPNQVLVGPAGGSVPLSVTVPAGVNWTGHSPTNWVLLDGLSDINRTSSTTVNLTVIPNETTEPRGIDLIVAEQTVKITQTGRDVNVTPLSAGFSKTDSILHGTVSPQGGVLMFGIEPENGAQWTIHVDTQTPVWAQPTQTVGSGTKTIMIAIAPYSTSESSRTATFQIGSQTLLVTQRGFDAVLNPSQQVVPNDGGLYEARLSVPSSVLWNAVSLTPWISITTAQQNSGAGSFFYRVEAGDGSQRFGYISVGGELFKVVQSSEPQEIRLRLQGVSGNTVGMELYGPTAASITIEESLDFLSWLPVQTVVGKGIEAVRLNLPYTAATKARFYRARK